MDLFALGIAFEAYSPLGAPARPVKGEGDANLMDDPVVKEIAAKHDCTPAQVSSQDSQVYVTLCTGIDSVCSSSWSNCHS